MANGATGPSHAAAFALSWTTAADGGRCAAARAAYSFAAAPGVSSRASLNGSMSTFGSVTAPALRRAAQCRAQQVTTPPVTAAISKQAPATAILQSNKCISLARSRRSRARLSSRAQP